MKNEKELYDSLEAAHKERNWDVADEITSELSRRGLPWERPKMKNESGLRVTGTHLLVKPEKIEEKTAGGIVLAKSTQEAEERAATRATLVDAGDDAWKVSEMKGVKIGDTVFFARYAGDNVHFLRDGVTYRVINASDVVGVVEAEFDSQFKSAETREFAPQT